MDDDRISLAHGNGGRFMRELIDEVFARHLRDSDLDVQADAVFRDAIERMISAEDSHGMMRVASTAYDEVNSRATEYGLTD